MTVPIFPFLEGDLYSMKSQSGRTTGLENWSKICTIAMALKLLTKIHIEKHIVASKSACDSHT